MSTDSGVTIIIAGEDQSGKVMDAVEARLKAASGSAQNFATHFKRAGEEAVPPMIAASASVRALQGNLEHNTRAVERFLSTTLHLGPVFDKLFPIVGAVTFGAVLVEDGEKLYEMWKTAEHATQAIHDGFASLNAQGQLANDELEVTNDKLRDTIAKLENKPKNGIKDAIDEALVEAEKLYIKLSQDDAKIADQLAKNHVGTINLRGHESTTPVDDAFKDYKERASDITFAANAQAEALRKVNDLAGIQRVRDKERVDLLNLQAQKIQEVGEIEAKAERSRDLSLNASRRSGKNADPSRALEAERIESARGVISALQIQSNDLRESADNEGLTATVKKLEEARDAAKGLNEEFKKEQEYLEKISKLGIGNIYVGGLNASEQVRRAQAAKLGDRASGEQQDQLGEYSKQQEQARQEAAEKKRIADEIAKQQYEIDREVQESHIREAETGRRITDEQAAYDVATGRIGAQQRIQIEQDAAQKELAAKKDAMEQLRALDVGISGNQGVNGPKELQRDLDQQKAIERQHNAEMLQLDQQAFEARRAAIQPFVDDIFQPLLDKPKSVSAAFQKMAEDIERSLAGIAEKRITDSIAGSVFGGSGGPSSGSGGGATTRGIGGVLGDLWGALTGRGGKAKTGKDSIQPSDAAAQLGTAAVGASGGVAVTIINQSSQPMGAASSSSSKDQAGNMVLSIILKDADKLGPITQALGGAFKMLPGN